ncbi:hypothetical protein [Psychrobacter sp.]|uniref:hypothetical protein n=1 Tax=Psychrobacter sp. TaxID=56811 RepID=UPI0025D13868|nr:hypothetical protein [Psychrobacter sp.]
MFSFFNRKTTVQLVPELPSLDNVLYPLDWQQQKFESAEALILYLIDNLSFNQKDLSEGHLLDSDNDSSQSELYYKDINLKFYQKQFSQFLSKYDAYQDWINFTVFGRYVQRSFSVFYQQTEDVFNADMPEILKHELMRHTQRLPKGQVLLVGGKLPLSVRRDKVLVTTLNPFQALLDALKENYHDYRKIKSVKPIALSPLVVNFITASSDKVKAFAVKHNKRTSQGLHNEVMILDFNHLILVHEYPYKNNAQSAVSYLIRHYTIG